MAPSQGKAGLSNLSKPRFDCRFFCRDTANRGIAALFFRGVEIGKVSRSVSEEEQSRLLADASGLVLQKTVSH
jgi:hypothetical protein